MRSLRPKRQLSCAVVVALLGLLMGLRPAGAPLAHAQTPTCSPWPICKIDHIVIIVQENRSFDHYFGVYKSPSGMKVDGIPRNPDGTFAVCVPNPVQGVCQKPYHSTNTYNVGGPHSNPASVNDVDGGSMDGFIRTGLWGKRTGHCILHPNAGKCPELTGPQGQPDVISFHTRAELPSYWAYADYGVLQDHMYEPVDSWSLPSHMYLVSGWAAECSNDYAVSTCVSDPRTDKAYNYPWADITYLLRNAGISWNYFVGDDTNLNCTGPSSPKDAKPPRTACNPTHDQNASSDGWLPILWFQSVKDAHDKGSVKHLSDFWTAISNDQLADVTWFIPPPKWSEHPGHAALSPGQRYVTHIVNAIGSSSLWDSTAIFITWDDWGGFYDHEPPVNAGDGMGYGIRVPGLMISPYAKTAYVDHQTISFDAYLKFIEDRFLGGARLDPATDGWSDPRPIVREDVAINGPGQDQPMDLSKEFDFTQVPRPAPILTLPPAGPAGFPYPDSRQWGFGDG